jgi:type VI secretion system protein ImpJ
VRIGRKNFRLTLDADRDGDEVSLALARVRRDASGRLIYDPEYAPPCLQIGASEALMARLAHLVAHLDDACARIIAERRAPRSSGNGAGTLDVAGLWLVHAVRSSVASLRHHLLARYSRPEQVYTELARLAGALCTIALESHPRALPTYDHERLGECFAALDRHIRGHLELLQPTNCVAVPLCRAEPYLYTGVVPDGRCFGQSLWVLGVRPTRAPMSAAELLALVPKGIKVCSGRFTLELVRRARHGLILEHLPTPPAAISPRADWQYFTIGRAGPCWQDTVTTGEIGVYVPEALADAELSLVVLLEE